MCDKTSPATKQVGLTINSTWVWQRHRSRCYQWHMASRAVALPNQNWLTMVLYVVPPCSCFVQGFFSHIKARLNYINFLDGVLLTVFLSELECPQL